MRQRNIGEEIKKLRSEGKSYNQIKEILNCSKSTISYHLGDNQKEKAYERNKKQRKLNPWLKKSENFVIKYESGDITNSKNYFDRKKLKEYLDSVDKCYLTGREVDTTDTKTYHFDHIIPLSKGGDSSFENLGITTPEANMSKTNMTVEEFIDLCKDVLINFGYDVIKK
jgi:CRISPR/Cas system Type II protein with McrA/HNH and RuvC-like nuclease domain